MQSKYYLSFMSSGAAVEVELPDRLLFTDTAYRQRYIDPNTVITTTNHGMWVVTAGSYHSPSASESVYVYEASGGEIMLSYLRSNIYRDGDAGPRCNSIDSDKDHPKN